MSKIVGEPEGATPLDPNEMAGLVFKHIQTRGQLDELEQVNIQAGMKWLMRQKKADPFTEQFVCELHKRLFGQVWDWAGSFRKTGKNIGCDAIQIGIELRNLLDDARYWVEHDTYPAKELAARFHHRLVAIIHFRMGTVGIHELWQTLFLPLQWARNPLIGLEGKACKQCLNREKSIFQR